MKLKSFRIKNYKSIVDSGECRLSDNDNITILAGQNESGKSSILQALRDFYLETVNLSSLREDGMLPEISCTYFSEEGIDAELVLDNLNIPRILIDKLNNITEINITREFNKNGDLNSVFSSSEIIKNIREFLLLDNESIVLKNEKEGTEDVPHDIDFIIEQIFYELDFQTPTIIFFDDFCDLLPDKILLSDIVSDNKDAFGLQAVKNIQTILQTDFKELDKVTDGKRETIQNGYQKTITAEFNEKWKQRISDGTGANVHVKYYQGGVENSPYLNFYIETKSGEYLPASKRSQGFKWFLSFFLHLKAEDKRENNLIILFDEPGLYLHSKAQSDMIAVFEELALKNQIVYSTHSPYLIDTSKINRLKLILNTKEHGTTIEKITSKKIHNQKDALKPIIDAIGLDVASPFSSALKNNVILEGISDFYYFLSMKTIFQKEYSIGFLPSMGSSNSHLLMELCMGWGLNWVLIFDDKGAVKDYNKIKKNFFNNDEDAVSKKIFRIKDCDGIEDAFTSNDLKLANEEAEFPSDKSNSAAMAELGGKELYSRIFYEKVSNGTIRLEMLDKDTIKRFKEVFKFFEEAFDLD